MKENLVLASASPRRREIFTMLGLDFTVQAADIAEAVAPGLTPEETVMSLAAQKAAAVKGCMGDSQRTIVGADTVVFFRIGFLANRNPFRRPFPCCRLCRATPIRCIPAYVFFPPKGKSRSFLKGPT